jgi:hypothetical protein
MMPLAEPPPLPRRVPAAATVDDIIQLLLDEPPGALVRVLSCGYETFAKGIVKTDRDGNVVIC